MSMLMKLLLIEKKTLYHRRTRSANCIVGDIKVADNLVKNCTCTDVDFEW